jgi:hypothetical protein
MMSHCKTTILARKGQHLDKMKIIVCKNSKIDGEMIQLNLLVEFYGMMTMIKNSSYSAMTLNE